MAAARLYGCHRCYLPFVICVVICYCHYHHDDDDDYYYYYYYYYYLLDCFVLVSQLE